MVHLHLRRSLSLVNTRVNSSTIGIVHVQKATGISCVVQREEEHITSERTEVSLTKAEKDGTREHLQG